MSITIRPTRWTIGLAIVLAVGLGALIYAATQRTYDKQTATFSVDEEGALALVTTYNAATGAEDPSWSSCGASGLQAGQVVHCLVSIQNQKTTGEIRYALHTIPSQVNGLSDSLNVQVLKVDTLTGCNASASAAHTPIQSLSASPGFNRMPGNPNDHVLSIGATDLMCLRITYAPGDPEPFGESLDAIVRVETDDTGL
jgi:hypothetical protein